MKYKRALVRLIHFLVRLIVGVWILSWSMAVLAAGFILLPPFLNLIDTQRGEFIPNNVIEQFIGNAMFKFSGVWFLISFLAVAVYVGYRGIKFLKRDDLSHPKSVI